MRRYLIAGLLVWVPLGITLWVLHFLFTTLDQTLLLLPDRLRPEAVFGFHIPGIGVVLFFVLLLGTGAIAANFFGARLILMRTQAMTAAAAPPVALEAGTTDVTVSVSGEAVLEGQR